ncbi:DNA/RNA non-specific endonuclease [Nocardia sp. NPDC057272]|uniref:DNA/RNA non-specific endonuclease n=1 Tax=Nocardia sp. NPDC057272 TaxID=3346079 RepID=UPI00363B8591
MDISEGVHARLALHNATIEDSDDELRAELAETRAVTSETELVAVPDTRETLDGTTSSSPAEEFGGAGFHTETIVVRTGRPVLTIHRDAAQLSFTDPDSEVWRTRLSAASDSLIRAARAVGRIEVTGHDASWLGTGWLLAPNVIVTNRHVAQEFGRAAGAQFVFRQGILGPMTASIDFLEEANRPEDLTFAMTEILHIEDDAGPDIALLRVDQTGPGTPAPIPMSQDPVVDDFLAVIGYPARDSRIPDQALMEQIYGDLYDKKRLAPGRLTRKQGPVILHDCTTLGGNSGSVVVSLTTGEAVGLHFAGRFLEANFAVAAPVVQQRLSAVLGRRGRPATPAVTVDTVGAGTFDTATPTAGGPARFSAVVPLRITVEIGDPYTDNPSAVSAPAPTTASPPTPGISTEDLVIEGIAADYLGRSGFSQTFLGADAAVTLPVVNDHDDVLVFDDNGRDGTVLNYEHFSVVMSRTRRMCLYSAVNIDGKQRARADRTQWRRDPRIPDHAQISKECYGPAPKFSRGHMTRREDPVWGPETVAARANNDSMHVTNAVPQMQTFNAGVWLDLENYALQNARRDQMRISVITGPFLHDDDPIKFDVRIPVAFWKVIVFIHDTTGALTATGYSLSQGEFLSEQEFVFGQHKTTQRRIEWIEQKAGLSFGDITALDPYREPESPDTELDNIHQIQFV